VVLSAQYITSIGFFYKEVGRLWRVSDFEELVGVITGDDEVDIGLPKIYHQLVNVTRIETATTIGLH